jgi:hypothetical protein
MLRIFKYSLQYEDRVPNISGDCCFCEMPQNAKIIHFDIQNEVYTIWAEVDDALEKEEKHFRIIPTGGAIPPYYKYVGTSLQNTPFVWHLYSLEGKA